MSDVKINITHPKVYGTDSKVMKLGEQVVDSKLASRLVKRGVAVEVEVKSKKQLSAHSQKASLIRGFFCVIIVQ